MLISISLVIDQMCSLNIQALEICWLGRGNHRRLGMGVRLLREGRGRGKGRDSRGWGISDEGVVGGGMEGVEGDWEGLLRVRERLELGNGCFVAWGLLFIVRQSERFLV